MQLVHSEMTNFLCFRMNSYALNYCSVTVQDISVCISTVQLWEGAAITYTKYVSDKVNTKLKYYMQTKEEARK